MSSEATLRWLVTGSRSGIGQAVTEHLLNQGEQVIGLCRHPEQTALAQHPYYHPWPLDLNNSADILPSCHALIKQHGPLDGLIHCAGAARFGFLEQLSDRQLQQQIALNLTAPLLLCRALLPALKQRPHSHIVLLGSEVAKRGGVRGVAYTAAKTGLRGLVRALHQEVAKAGVCVSLIHPGLVATPFYAAHDFRPGDQEQQRLIADDVAKAIGFVLQQRPGLHCPELELSALRPLIQKKPA